MLLYNVYMAIMCFRIAKQLGQPRTDSYPHRKRKLERRGRSMLVRTGNVIVITISDVYVAPMSSLSGLMHRVHVASCLPMGQSTRNILGWPKFKALPTIYKLCQADNDGVSGICVVCKHRDTCAHWYIVCFVN